MTGFLVLSACPSVNKPQLSPAATDGVISAGGLLPRDQLDPSKTQSLAPFSKVVSVKYFVISWESANTLAVPSLLGTRDRGVG